MVSEALKKGGSVLILTHRIELLKQSGEAFEMFDLKPEYITAGSKPNLTYPLHVSMVETLNKRKDDYASFIAAKSLVIIDEAHLQHFNKIFGYFSNKTYVIGATATPFRKGSQFSLDEFYQDIIQEVDTPELIEQGFLSKALSYGVDIDIKGLSVKGDDYDTKNYYEEVKMYKGVVDNYLKHAKRLKTIIFASNVESSKQVCQEFIFNGFEARHIDGYMHKDERDKILHWFKNTPDAIICNCGILTAGFDVKDIGCVILYRATTSKPLFLQMCGRGSRIVEGKDSFKILDFGNNIRRLGFWEDPRVWSLKKTEKKEKAKPIKRCPKCEAINSASARKCINCGFAFMKKEDEDDEDEIAELILLSNKNEILRRAMNKESPEFMAKAIKMKALKLGHVLHQLKPNEKDYRFARDLIKALQYKAGWYQYNKFNYKVFDYEIRR